MEIQENELQHLLEEIKAVYGYDFKGYSIASFQRRVNKFAITHQFSTVEAVMSAVLNDESTFEQFLQEITVNVTELFRDPSFFKIIRNNIVSVLKTYPVVKIWDAGCSSGEETYSMSIVLHEEGLLKRCKIYATDLNQKVLYQAKSGIYKLENITSQQANYIQGGGKGKLSDYYKVEKNQAVFNDMLKQHMVFAIHNLVSDSSFNEFNLIICRNVLIYFQKPTQERVIQLFYDSLVMFGFLALGTKEALPQIFMDKFELVDARERIYRKVN